MDLRTIYTLAAAAVLLVMCACDGRSDHERAQDALMESAAAIVEQADTIEILFTEINPRDPVECGMTHPELGEFVFADYPVISRTTVEVATGRALFSRLQKSVEAWPYGSSVACFCPRHAIVASLDGRRVELLICFECSKLRCFIYEGDTLQSYDFDIGMEDDARDYFNRIYLDAGLRR